MKTAEEKEKEKVSWNDVKEIYLKFHRMDKFTENMAIDIDFGYWLANEVIKEVLHWRDPNIDPPINQDVVLVKTDNNCYSTAYYHGNASGFITYGEDAYIEFGEIIGWRPIE